MLLHEASDVEVYVKHRGSGPGRLTGAIYQVPNHPFDVVGWDGCLYPYTFSISDFEPISSRSRVLSTNRHRLIRCSRVTTS
jgi:homogentisate 1,2-dioxygenase